MRLFGTRPPTRQRRGADRASAAFDELEMFVDAGLSWVEPALLRTSRPRTGTRLFFIGAVETLAQRYRLGSASVDLLDEKALRRAGFADEELREHPEQKLDEPFVTSGLTEGRRTMELWLDGDADAPMRLAQLVREWKRRP